ncbi:biopolymer transport protein ExbD [Tepidamorphus gemmatus]|uniref:Biopolymer transport protein ExbD n=1 Tax=Tepidamorphus gemmatus TaxID=747076 RepID=A0A4R3ME90_9HYPH|nr:biopolymer transporter ExbD [Tepidamorphus gemmatus]TCT10619.1 biopolymer transport protein ExbD [Tepidamorphus gemmatus]
MRLVSTPRPRTDDGVVPLINVVFLLLIFFLIAGTLMPRADFRVDFARTAESPASRPPADAIYVSQAGFVSWRGQALSPDRLGEAVAADPALDRSAPLPVVLDRALPAGDLSAILAALAGAGVQQVRLVTRREAGR